MKANEFVKKFGWEKSKMAVKKLLPMEDGMPVFDYNSEDLKRLVESYELVEEEGGIDKVKDTFIFAYKHGAEELTEHGKIIKQAIADVESCL